ncbi:MAG: leucine-rich repeat domain-containing protein, partial [Clostridia bacterium]|nr:leucine-rich repeat domain-containing protein [Clostridia bacterium]
MKKRVLAAVIAAVFAVLNVASALPVFALDESTTRYPTPEGYNDNDYQKLVAFLEQTDEEGVKNGEKLSENYDPNDPTTWGTYYYGNQRFQWIESDGELRIQRICVLGMGLCGALDVSGCTALEDLDCRYNNLTTLDVSGCTALEDLDCDGNNLTTLDVSGCTALTYVECYY